jgi:hypothetical protein
MGEVRVLGRAKEAKGRYFRRGRDCTEVSAVPPGRVDFLDVTSHFVAG